MTRSIYSGDSQVWGLVTLVDTDGAKATGVLAADVAISYQIEGAATVGPLTLTDSALPAWAEGRWLELGGGDYRVGLPVALAGSDNLNKAIRLFGTYTGGDLHAETLLVVPENPGTGNGPRLVTISVEDQDQNPVPNAQVYVYSGSRLVAEGQTDGDGELQVRLADGDYTALVWLSAFDQDDPPHAFTVSAASTSTTITGTDNVPSVTPPAGTTTGRAYCRKKDGTAEANVPCWFQYETSETDPDWLPYEPFSVESGADGWADFEGLVHGCTGYAWREGSKNRKVLVAIPSSGSSFNFPAAVGMPVSVS